MWSDRSLSELLGIEHPIIQAPMAGAATPALAAAVSNAGALGSLGCAFLDPEGLRREVEATRRATNRPINVNFFVHSPPAEDAERAARARERLAPFYRELALGPVPEVADQHQPFDEAMLAEVLALAPRVVSFHFGLPAPPLVAALKNAGHIVLSSATSVREARLLVAGGVDAVIAQGWEAGGHRGTFASSFDGAAIGTFALVPQIVDAVSVPVVAAGGIADGRGIAAAFALGAAGVQLGTAFLSCPEAATSDAHRQALRESVDEGTRLTKAFSGRPARGLVNRYLEAMAPHQNDLPDFPLMNGLSGPLRAAGAKRGSPDFVALWSGQAGPMNRELSAAELLARLIEEARTRLPRGG
jgi:nitronate monooxygenase